MTKLNYPIEEYEQAGLYDGDMDGEEIACYKSKMVKVRKEHACINCQRVIKKGEYALSESGFMDGVGVSCYTCAECIEDWLFESGQVKSIGSGLMKLREGE